MHVIGPERADPVVCHHASLLRLLHSAQFSYLQAVSELVLLVENVQSHGTGG